MDEWLGAVSGLIGALAAVLITVRVQRQEAQKQRQIAAASEVLVNAFQIVRYCHRHADTFRDYDSKFDTSLRAWGLDLLHADGRRLLLRYRRFDGRRFLEEAVEWRVRLQKDALAIVSKMEADANWNTHDGAELVELRHRVRYFADYVTAWAANPKRGPRNRIVCDMKNARAGWHSDGDTRGWLRPCWPNRSEAAAVTRPSLGGWLRATVGRVRRPR